MIVFWKTKTYTNIHYYYNKNDKKYADMHQLLTESAVINIANNSLEAGKSHKIV